MRHLPALLLLFAAACGLHAPRSAPEVTPAPAAFARLRDVIERRVSAVPGAEVGVWLQDLRTGETLAVNSATRFHAASTMKVPVMIELFRRHDAGELQLDSTLVLRNEFRSIVDGSPYSLDALDDSDSSLYARVDQRVTFRELNERMITRSSNLATNAVIELLGAGRVEATAHALGAVTMQVRRGVEDGKAFSAGLNNTTSARDLGVLMAAVARHQAASPSSCEAMLAILRRQEFNDEIPAGLPKGTAVAHKTGWITATTHDAAIIYPPRRPPYVLVVLTRAIPRREVAQALMAGISRDVWQSVTGR